jgi:two-component system OmpR family response regulator/two-component system copper resistance phosphate regulon response regulator CusR
MLNSLFGKLSQVSEMRRWKWISVSKNTQNQNFLVMKILIVEDDPVLGPNLSRGLGDLGHQTVLVDNASDALSKFETELFDVIILDQMLPTDQTLAVEQAKYTGLALLKKFRRVNPEIGILILTAIGGIDDRVEGLNLGADDYLTKPFAFPELTARLAALNRRQRNIATQLSLDLTQRRVVRSNREIELTPTEFSLLELFMRNAGQTVTRKMLCEHLWESNWEGVTNVIEVHINRLRNKINKGNQVGLIHTVRGSGYVLRED